MSEMVPAHRRQKELEFEGGNPQNTNEAMKKRLKGFLNRLMNRQHISTRQDETDMEFENPYATQEISQLETPTPSPSKNARKQRFLVNDISGLSKISKADTSAFDAQTLNAHLKSIKSTTLKVPKQTVPVDLVSESSKSWKEVAVEELGPIEIFFDTTYNDWVKGWRWVIIIFGLGMAAFAGYSCRKI